MKLLDRVLGKKVSGVRVVPLMVKIVTIFTVFLLVSNVSTNYLNLTLNQGEQIRLLNKLLIADLKDLHVFASNQFEIFQFNQDLDAARENITQSTLQQLEQDGSLAMGLYPDGSLFMLATPGGKEAIDFSDQKQLEQMNSALEEGVTDGLFRFVYDNRPYIGVYKYHPRWELFFIRAEDQNEFYADSVRIFQTVLWLILAITLVCAVVGVLILRRILKFVGVITGQIMGMQERQAMELVDIRGAPNDDISYLGVAFNSLASTIENLLNIFKKFVARDVAQKAYREREIRLEGSKRELAILFTDIKGFTFMTETLGTDIIKLLNLHYEQAIRHIHENNGDVGSIIGDALLAVFGVIGRPNENKCYQAIRSGYQIIKVAADLREQMFKRREQILANRGSLSEAEERVFKAVLIDVGVGIDGGEVFYGNIGSNERMVNTVIGDNVNSSSRLEGLTRFYRVPMIVSEYVKEHVMADFEHYYFVELDQVQVKGKTIGKRIYWPLDTRRMDVEFKKRAELFDEALYDYYEGDWKTAYEKFSKIELPMAEIFRQRTQGGTPPRGWSGIWTMTEK
jgi:class 3 adenylate cyclase